MSLTTPNPASAGRDQNGRGLVSRRLVLAATSLGFAMIQLDVSVVNVAIKPIGTSLGGGVTALQWVVDAYTMAFAAFILTAGALGDRNGAKRLFITGFAVFAAASAAAGLAPSIGALIAGRAVQGVGAAILGACSLSLLNHAHPDPGDRARAVGVWAAGASAALAGGPLVGGVLTATLGWRSIFFINAPIGLAGIWLTARFAAETPRTRDRGLDPWGQSSAVVALIAFAAAAIEAGLRGWIDPFVLSGFAAAVIAGAAFVTLEAKSSTPMLPLRLFNSGTFSSAIVIGLLVNVAFYGLVFVLSLFFQREHRLSPLQTGLGFVPMMAAIMVGNLVTGRLALVMRARRVIAVGGLVMAGGCLTMLGADAATPYPALLSQLVALGFGLGLIVPLMTAALMGSVDPSRSGMASGTLNAVRQTGSVLGVALFGSLSAGTVPVTGLHLALAISGGLVLAVAVLGTKLREGV